MKPRHLLLIGSLTAIAVSIASTGMAFADDRYSDLPPVRVRPGDFRTMGRAVAGRTGPATHRTAGNKKNQNAL